ncbi:uncharacterized protein LOC131257394 [Magnolia sinica]|uniref:uncharacterized protein LOC131257394 n=1 Tax=Magnolia sinica TaxID=86752 RepID=UPI0026580F3D|nr:uncharacterized protein LOC131257394 [Magnolia sinica]
MGGGEAAKRWLENIANDRSRDEGNCQSREFKALEQLALSGIQVLQSETGRILCSFVVPKRLADRDGNWHMGAMATVIDDVGAAAIVSIVGWSKSSVDFNISYFSTVMIDEEVEIEGRVLGHKGKLSSVIVEVRKKGSGQIVAMGKQWMKTTFHLARSKSKL